MEYVEALEMLKLSEGFCNEDLKKAYKSASKIYHPDLGGSTEMMQKVNEAYDLLLKEPRYIHITKSYNRLLTNNFLLIVFLFFGKCSIMNM